MYLIENNTFHRKAATTVPYVTPICNIAVRSRSSGIRPWVGRRFSGVRFGWKSKEGPVFRTSLHVLAADAELAN
jgi:hypothetical protein